LKNCAGPFPVLTATNRNRRYRWLQKGSPEVSDLPGAIRLPLKPHAGVQLMPRLLIDE
jgi:hypothetical protein